MQYFTTVNPLCCISLECRLSPLLQPIKNMFFSPKKPAAPSTPSVAASPAISAAQAAADAAAEDGGADSDDASVSTMDSVDGRALDDLEVGGLFY
jgi:hypothetical protein